MIHNISIHVKHTRTQMRTSLFFLALSHTHNSQESSRSRIKSQSPDASFTHNNQESSRSQIKSQSPDASSSSKFLEDLGRVDIFGPLSGEQDPHDRPIATVGISLGNTHTHTCRTRTHAHFSLYGYGISAWNTKTIHFSNASFGKTICKISHACHIPTHKHIHGCLRVCSTKFSGMVVCISSGAGKRS